MHAVARPHQLDNYRQELEDSADLSSIDFVISLSIGLGMVLLCVSILNVVSRSSIGSLQEWSLPEYGIFELDYVSCYRPPARAKPLSDELWESLMVSMYNCKESGDSA